MSRKTDAVIDVPAPRVEEAAPEPLPSVIDEEDERTLAAVLETKDAAEAEFARARAALVTAATAYELLADLLRRKYRLGPDDAITRGGRIVRKG